MVQINAWVCTLFLAVLIALDTSCAGAATIKAISAGAGSMVLMDDGTVYAWGNNASHHIPEKVQGLSNINTISSYSVNYMALSDNGDVWFWTWQNNQDSTPDLVKVPISNVKAISVPTMLKDDGTVWEITPENNRYLFISDTKNICVRQVPGLSNVTAIGRDVAIKDDGTVWTWLNISQGAPLIGEFDPVIPVKVNISDVKQVVTSDSTTLALKNDGTVWAWGHNGFGLFGNGVIPTEWSSEATLTPVQTEGINHITSISIYTTIAWALKDDGTVWMWGGDPYTLNGAISYRTPHKMDSINNVVAISMGDMHAMALKGDGTLWAWGGNWEGQLGDGTVTAPLDHSGGKDTPVKVLIDTSGSYSFSATPVASPSLGPSVSPSSGSNASAVAPSAGGSAMPVGGNLPLGNGVVSIIEFFLGLLVAGGLLASLRRR